MSSTLRQMTDGDFLTFKDCLGTFMNWYRTNCEKLKEMSEIWMETEDEVLVNILSRGLRNAESLTEIMKETDKNGTEQ